MIDGQPNEPLRNAPAPLLMANSEFGRKLSEAQREVIAHQLLLEP